MQVGNWIEQNGVPRCAAPFDSFRRSRCEPLCSGPHVPPGDTRIVFTWYGAIPCYQGWMWCTQSYTVGLGQLELTGRDASIAADGLSTTLRDDLECAVSTVEENRRHAVPAGPAKVSNAPSPKKGGGSCKVKSQGKSQRPAQAPRP